MPVLVNPYAFTSAPAGLILVDKVIAYGTGTSTNITIPAAAQAGDRMILVAHGGFTPVLPATQTWRQVDRKSGTNQIGFTATRTVTAGDVSSPTVTVTFTGGSFAHELELVVFRNARLRQIPSTVRAGSSTAAQAITVTDGDGETGDYALSVGGYRASSQTIALTNGVVIDSRTADTNASAVIGGRTLGSDTSSVADTFTCPGAGSGHYLTESVWSPQSLGYAGSTTEEGQDRSRVTGGTFLYQEAVIVILQPIRLETVKADIAATGTYTLTIDGSTFGSAAAVVGRTADVAFTGSLDLEPGEYLFRLTATGAVVWDDNNSTPFSGTYWKQAVASSVTGINYGGTLFAFNMPIRLVFYAPTWT